MPRKTPEKDSAYDLGLMGQKSSKYHTCPYNPSAAYQRVGKMPAFESGAGRSGFKCYSATPLLRTCAFRSIDLRTEPASELWCLEHFERTV